MTLPITWLDLKGPDEFDYTHLGLLGAEADALFDLIDVEHDIVTGAHDTQKVARGVGSFEEDGTTVKVGGMIASATRVSAGVYTVTLTADLAVVSGALWYQVGATLRPGGLAGDGFIRENTASRAAGSYRIETFDIFGAPVDRHFFTKVHGVPA